MDKQKEGIYIFRGQWNCDKEGVSPENHIAGRERMIPFFECLRSRNLRFPNWQQSKSREALAPYQVIFVFLRSHRDPPPSQQHWAKKSRGKARRHL